MAAKVEANRNRPAAPRLLLFAVILFSAAVVFAQNSVSFDASVSSDANVPSDKSVSSNASVSLDGEIQNFEKAVAVKGVSAEERRDALIRLARLRQLSGDIEGAAKNWLEAAAAIPGDVDDNALLACAYCLAAMGEWDRAGKALEPLLVKSTQARFLDASIKAVKSGETQSLSALAKKPEYSQMKSQIFFMLWKLSKGDESETWRQRLITEAPQSPEGRLAVGEKSSVVIINPSPFWLFLNGLDSLPIVKTEIITAEKPAPAPTAVPKTTVETEKRPSSPAEKPAPASVSQPPASQVKLQTGLFGKEVNAQAQIAKLEKAGFSPSLEQRGEKWAVVVPAGADSNRVINDLKNAGFDSFPIR
jgi:tetratricopeptide (TPR) repeat protein